MALELQNDEQQRVMSDNLSISASNRLVQREGMQISMEIVRQ
jgi:hypothetical protein